MVRHASPSVGFTELAMSEIDPIITAAPTRPAPTGAGARDASVVGEIWSASFGAKERDLTLKRPHRRSWSMFSDGAEGQKKILLE